MTGRLLLALAALSFLSCNVTQFLPPDELLYRGAELDIISADSVKTSELELELLTVLDQHTNAKIPLIGYRNIYRYYKFEEKKRKKPEKYVDDPDEIKGEEPVFYDELVAEATKTLLENKASNNGYFINEATFTSDTSLENREVSLDFELSVGPPYLLDTMLRSIRDTAIAGIIDSVADESYLNKGDRYDLDAIKSERVRWKEALKRRGYFYANDEDFLFLADTVTGDHRVATLAKLKAEIPPQHFRPQRITEINIYPDFDVADTSNRYRLPVTEIGGLRIFCAECPLRAKVIDEGFAMKAGDLYDPDQHRKTLRRLAGYKTFRYISMDYEEEAGSDSTLILNAFMTPLLRRRVEGELGLTYNSARYVGPNVRLAYTNRNMFRGAELFKISGDFSYTKFLGSSDQIRVPTSGVYGIDASLTIPRLWLPKRRKILPRVTTSGTVISVGGKMEQLSLTLAKFSTEIREQQLGELAALIESDPEATESVTLMQLRAQYGYTWQRRVKKSHSLNPFSVRYQDPLVNNDQVLSIARTLGLSAGVDQAGGAQTSRFDRMIVFSPNYTLTYDTRLDGEDVHNLFWQQYLSMNLNNIFPVGPGTEDAERVTSLYPQLETDLRYYWRFSRPTSLNFRVHGGIAFPLSDRAIVPYFDLYSVGGPNSLRGFIPRGVGPGRTVPVNNNLLSIGGFGNLMLESSVELRHKINALIEFALFYDAGNVWTYKTENEPLDTDFRQTQFVNELAMDYGVGVRFDLTFLIFRLDIAFPFQIPYEDETKAFRVPMNFKGPEPSKDPNIVIAFGYPF